ncbi:FAD-dependent monooxygenase [Actinomycetospora sp. OC33-EN08]|uniref:FAD-dependent monooxygenase n=1 Tax=Actinomycetospora aurantiaca TaxID=3129233 RepID=A0ABU8MLZ9_9PSEU
MGTSVVVVGGGPGGVLLTYLLARGGIEVTLLEARHDFARRFRGDTLAPGVLEYLDDLGLADDLLAEVPHTRSDAFRWHTPERTYRLLDYRGASSRFPFYALIPQARFLPWLAAKAEGLGAVVRMGARFSDLVRAGDRVTGVRYTVDGEAHEIAADLVVGADGPGRRRSVRRPASRPPSSARASICCGPRSTSTTTTRRPPGSTSSPVPAALWRCSTRARGSGRSAGRSPRGRSRRCGRRAWAR